MNKTSANLATKLSEALPKATITIDDAETATGSSFVDVSLRGRNIAIELRPNRGFGVTSTESAVFGEGPHETYASEAEVIERVTDLVSLGLDTTPGVVSGLASLRLARGVTQVQLAESLGINQAAVSQLERRPNIGLVTLVNIIERLGGRLEIRTVFGDDDVHVWRPGTGTSG